MVPVCADLGCVQVDDFDDITPLMTEAPLVPPSVNQEKMKEQIAKEDADWENILNELQQMFPCGDDQLELNFDGLNWVYGDADDD